MGTNQLQAVSAEAPGTAAASALPATDWLRWGPLQLHPHGMYRVSYGNGILAGPGQPAKTLINEVSPGMLINLGSKWKLDYTPTLRFYSSSRFRDTLDHSVLLSGGTTYEDWIFGLSQSYISSSTPLVETASQTAQQNYATALSATRFLSTKMSLELGANQSFRFVGQSAFNQALSDSKDWSTMEWLNYQFWPKFGLALGAGGGYSAISHSTDMTYYEIQGRLNWSAGTKLTLSLSGGFEDRQFVDAKAPDLINPLFGLTAFYQLFQTTTFSLSATRSVNASYFQNQITENTSVTAHVRQRLLKKLSLDLSGGYSLTTYDSTTVFGLPINREDDRSFVNIRLTAPFLKRGTASVYYDYSKNTSTAPGFHYASNQTGLELGYQF